MDSSINPPKEPAAPQPVLAHRAASGAMWIALEMGSTQATSLLVFAIMARFVTPADFGLMSISYLAIYTFKSLVIDNIVVGISRKPDPSDLDYTTSFWLTFFLSVVASLGLFLSAGAAEQVMNAPHLGNVMRAMSVILLFLGLSRTHEMRLIRLFQFRTLALRSIVGAVLGGSIGIALAIRGYGLSALVVQQVTTSGISLALLWASASWSPGLRFSKQAAREIFAFMRTMAPSTALNVVSQNFDTFLVAFFFGPSSVGFYSIAKRLRLALQLVATTPINGVLFSTLAEVQLHPERLKSVSQRLIAMICLVGAPVFLGSSSIAGQAISIGFGEQWVAAAPIFAVLTLGGFFATLQNLCETMFILKNRQIWSFYVLFGHTAIAILLFFPMKLLGPSYLAVPFVLPYAVTFPIAAWLVSRLAGLSLAQWLSAVIPSLASAMLMFTAVRLIDLNLSFPNNLVEATACVGCGAAVYAMSMLVVNRSAMKSAFRVLLGAVR